MMEKIEKKWKTQTRGYFTFIEMCQAIENYINSDHYSKYKINVGTDSQKHKDYTRFVTAVVIYCVGKGGQYYLLTEDVQYINSLRQKIMYEVNLTFKYKEMLKDTMKDFLKKNNIHIKPHADIGEYGETKKFIQEIKRMFKGFGIEEEIEIKPNSIASSAVANKFSK